MQDTILKVPAEARRYNLLISQTSPRALLLRFCCGCQATRRCPMSVAVVRRRSSHRTSRSSSVVRPRSPVTVVAVDVVVVVVVVRRPSVVVAVGRRLSVGGRPSPSVLSRGAPGGAAEARAAAEPSAADARVLALRRRGLHGRGPGQLGRRGAGHREGAASRARERSPSSAPAAHERCARVARASGARERRTRAAPLERRS